MAHAIHHVSAIAGPAWRNHAFCTGVLAQHLVKRTVNVEGPGTWHSHEADGAGAPGSVPASFPVAHVAPAHPGIGEVARTAPRVPAASLAAWAPRLGHVGVPVGTPARRFGEAVLPSADPDGTQLALGEAEGVEAEPAWAAAGLPADRAVRGRHGVTRPLSPGSTTGTGVDLRAARGDGRGLTGSGSVHHVAVRAADEAEQAARARRPVEAHGPAVTPVKDRTYLRSVYLRATDGPGFAVDEPAGSMKRALTLPARLQDRRHRIAAALPGLAA